ncbi:type II toxin-antitoxin system VapB family antitoxin [Nocardia tengchongensis]
MATTVEIPDEVLAEAMRLTGLTTKKAVINLAMSELVQGYRQREALTRLKRMDHNPFLTSEELAGETPDRP